MINKLLLVFGILIQGTTAPIVAQTGVKISGAVTREDGQTGQTTRVILSGSGVSRTFSSAGVTFEFANVLPGVYQLIAGPGMPPVPVVVADKDVSVQLRVPIVIRVAGTVSVDGGGVIPRFQIIFTNVAAAAGATPSVPVTAATAFTVSLPNGEYRVSATGLPAGFSVRSMMSGSADLASQTLRIAAANSPPPQIAVALDVSSPPPTLTNSGALKYKGFTIAITSIGPTDDRDAVFEALRRQIDIVDEVHLNNHIREFMTSVPISVVAPADIPTQTPVGTYYRGPKNLIVKSDIANDPFTNPILLHELLHAYHDQIIPNGWSNAEILKLFQQARDSGKFPADSYMLSNVQEYFAMMASVYLHGRAARDPFTRQDIKDKQPDCYQWLEKEFGPQ